VDQATNPDNASRDDIAPVPDSARDSDSLETEQKTDTGEPAEYRLADPEPPSTPVDVPDMSQPGVVEEGAETTFQASTEEGVRPVPEKFPDPPPEVSRVWSRWAEWQEPLIWSSAGVALAILIVYAGGYVAILMFLLAISYGAYCVVTSLEIPVRVTPEQAIQEYYAAANHRLPNFRRMYALLTDDAKRCAAYSYFAQFRAYWMQQIARFSRSPTWLVPLEFRVEGFKCRYNQDKTLAAVRYVVRVAPRSQSESAQPSAEFDVRNLAVKGPDGQWYVNDGTLPE
jgi:hypothetical protein